VNRLDLLALGAALEADLAAAERHRELAVRFLPRLGEAGADTVVAGSLHHYYSAIEALVERAMRAFGHALPAGPRWHAELLTLAATDIAGTRPALLGPTSLWALHELLAFRHFFRHAYAVDWDVERLRRNVEIMTGAAAPVRDDVAGFVTTLREAAVT